MKRKLDYARTDDASENRLKYWKQMKVAGDSFRAVKDVPGLEWIA
jgi:hypothetical protein